MLSNRGRLGAHYIIARTAMKESICYPADVVIEFISYPIAFMGYFYFVLAMFQHSGGLAGYTLSGLITYFSVGWLLRMIIDQGVDDTVAGDVLSGDVALALVRPMSLQDYLFSRFIGTSLARAVYYVLPAVALLFLLFGQQIQIEPMRLLWFVPYALIAFRLAFELQYFLGILSFFIIVNSQVSWSVDMLIRLISGLIVPLNLFPPAVATTLERLPFQYLYYRPIQVLLEPTAPAELLTGLAVGVGWVAAFHLVNRRVFALAMRQHLILGG